MNIPLGEGRRGSLGDSDLVVGGALLDLGANNEEDGENGGVNNAEGDARVENSLISPLNVLGTIDQRDHDKHTSETVHFVD